MYAVEWKDAYKMIGTCGYLWHIVSEAHIHACILADMYIYGGYRSERKWCKLFCTNCHQYACKCDVIDIWGLVL